jgi:adenosylcobinamide-GDP ribazoletransferase
MKFLRLAFTLLTIFPMGKQSPPEPGDTGRAAFWFPWVGAVIGFITAAGWEFFHLILPIIPAAVLTLIFWVVMTGALHLDGLADCCDGMFSSARPERRLEIMSDSRLGTFAAVGLILFLILKLAALNTLTSTNLFFVLIFSSTLSRWFVLLAGRQPIARPEGMAADFAAGLTNTSILAGAVLPVALIFWGGWPAALAAIIASLAVTGIFAFARSRIGGVTGDVFGLIIEVTELMVLLTYAAL